MKTKGPLLSIMLVIILLFSSTSIANASDSVVPEVRALLQNSYVDPVSEQVLNATTVDEMLKRLGDPHTTYFSAADYANFINSLDMRFSGIGVYVDIVPEGVLITSVIPGSPAEQVGLKKNDIIIQAGTQILAGLPLETATSYIRGLDGSALEITVKRGTQHFAVTVIRRTINIPTVTGEVLNGQIGYIKLNSFGSDSTTLLGEVLNKLKAANVQRWIVDLRDNPGGYLSSALGIAGYFIGPNPALQIKGRSGPTEIYTAADQGSILNQPVIFLTNKNSASASEILSAAVKDQAKATLIGTTTYGKGSVQSMYSLSDGGTLKMTIAHFFSPLGQTIDKVGIAPDLPLMTADALTTAQLMLSNTGPGNLTPRRGDIQLQAGPNSFSIQLEQARKAEYWSAFNEILTNVESPSLNLEQWANETWTSVSTTDLNMRWPLLYPDYRNSGTMTQVPLVKNFTISFSRPVNATSVTNQSVELIDALSGERTLLDFNPVNQTAIQVTPRQQLKPGSTYWLIVHTVVQGTDGQSLKAGAILIVKTVETEVGDLGLKTKLGLDNNQVNHLDYGQAIIESKKFLPK